MTASAGPALRDLHARYGDRVAFMTLYVREAHPGERYPQPDTMARKRGHAADYRERDGVEWAIALDDLEGTLHRQLDPRPHAAYLMAPDGTVAYRLLWANDVDKLEAAIGALLSEHALPLGQAESRLLPLTKGMGRMYDVLDAAGEAAKSDARRELPPMYGLARVASLFRPLPPLGRGIAAVGVGLAGAVGVALLARRALR